MSSTEVLRTQMDTLRLELQRLQVENARLRDERPEQADEIDAQAEVQRYQQENEQHTSEIQELRQRLHEAQESEAKAVDEAHLASERLETLERQLQEERDAVPAAADETEQLKARCAQLESCCNRLETEGEQERVRAELEKYRALESERHKWEAREERLLEQLRELEARKRSGGPSVTTVERAESIHTGEDGGEPVTSPCLPLVDQGSKPPAASVADQPEVGVACTKIDSGTSQSVLSSALLAQQLPPIAKFSGETQQEEGETIGDWIEQFEMIASVAQWDQQTKLVNLTTRLRGQAYSFYRSCTTQQRGDYDVLVAELTKRFTPVRLQSVQSSQFHDRKQRPHETVDAYAQDLRRLFHGAYPQTRQGTQETEDMGRAVLAYQFVSGMLPDIKMKLTGVEGAFDQLLVKARFEEAKLRDLTGHAVVPMLPKKPYTPFLNLSKRPRDGGPAISPVVKGQVPPKPTLRCFQCNGTGHFARNCPLRGRSAPAESQGQTPGIRYRNEARKVATIQADSTEAEPRQEPRSVAELRRQLQEAEVEESLTKVAATMHVLQPGEKQNDLPLGPALMAEVNFEGTPVRAFLDTGSPVSIVSLSFLLQSLAKQRPTGQTPTEWQQAVRMKLHPPTITLHSYGGKELNIVRQLTAVLSCGDHRCEATVLVQKKAPLDLLLGTDLQAKLGFFFLQEQPDGTVTDLLQKESWELTPAKSREHCTEATFPFFSESTLEAEKVPAVVRLISATRLPARHVKYVRARVEDYREQSPALFESEENLHKERGVTIEAAATQPDADGCITLAIHNQGLLPVRLSKGHLLGSLQPVTLLPDPVEGIEMRALHSRSHQYEESTSRTEETNLMNGRSERLLDKLNLETAEIKSNKKEPLKQLLLQYTDLFALDPTELGSTNLVQHVINTGDSQPVRQPARRIPFALRDHVDEMVGDMLEHGIIHPSKSPWASPIVLVAKKDGTTRFCVDYRRLNSVTKLDVFPLPRIDDSLDLLAHSKYFSTLDLASGYWQVQMDPESQEKTAFVTHSGLYEFAVMPFGLCNAPATFQRLMETVLAGLARNICVVYLDDILVMGRTLEEHLTNLEKVFDRLREAGLRLKPAKCRLVRREVEYLGYIVSDRGVAPDPKKVEAVRDFPVPSNLKYVRSFLGLASYYRRFIESFSKVANPLFALTRKDVPFEWSPSCQQAFDTLKKLLTEAPVLAFPDFSKDFLLDTDASGVGLGAVLAQKQEDGTTRPIAYASRTLQKHEQNYGITELEALGVVWAVKHFRCYLYGHRCDVNTDHQALQSLLNTPHPSGKLARWGLALQELDLHIHYRSGKQNLNADALSCVPFQSTAEAESSSPSVVLAAIQTAEQPAKGGDGTLGERQQADPELQEVFEYLSSGTLPEEAKRARELALTRAQYEAVDGILYHVEPDKTLRVIPAREDRRTIFNAAHSGMFGAHLREAKIHGQLAKHYWWPGMRADIATWCRSCLTCASYHVGRAIRPPLTPIPVSGPFDRLGVDVIQFPKSRQGNQYAVVFVDFLTKWPEVFPTSDQTALTIAHLLVEQVISRHGVPSDLLSDRGTAFLSKLMQAVYQIMGIHKTNTTAYHPQTDGLVERFNRTLTSMLAKTVEEHGRDWDERLPYVLFAYRTSLQESTRESPFFLLYGRDPRLPVQRSLTAERRRELIDLDDYKSELVVRLSDAWALAKTHVQKAQRQQKKYHDRRAKDPEFRIGDRVFIYMPAAKQGKAHKFARPFRGPYRIVNLFPNGAEVIRIDKPQLGNIRVALNRVRRCPKEIPDSLSSDPAVPEQTETEDNQSIPPGQTTATEVQVPDHSPTTKTPSQSENPNPEHSQPREIQGVWKSRLRSRKRPGEDAGPKGGEL